MMDWTIKRMITRNKYPMTVAILATMFLTTGIMTRATQGQIQVDVQAAIAGVADSSDKEEDANSQDVFAVPPHAVKRHLSKAKKAIAEERFSDAVDELGWLMDNPESNDYFLETTRKGEARRSLLAETRRLLASLPPKGQQAYENRYGALARKTLDEAIDNRNIQGIEDVLRKYFYTEAGSDATMLLGRYYMNLERPLHAAICFSRLTEVPRLATRHEPMLSLQMAACWQCAGMPERAKSQLLALKAAYRGKKVWIGDTEKEIFRDDAKALQWLNDILGEFKFLSTLEADQWVTYRGNNARNAKANGGSPLSYPRWKIPVPNDFEDQKQLEKIQKQYLAQDIAAMPGIHPLIVRYNDTVDPTLTREVVITRTPERVWGVDFTTGQRLWHYPFSLPEAEDTQDKNPNVMTRNGQRVFISTSSSRYNQPVDPDTLRLQQRTWEDSPFGQLCTDGKRLYFLDNISTTDPNRQLQRFSAWGTQPKVDPETNRLVALDLTRQGAMSWTLDGKDGELLFSPASFQDDMLKGAFFLGTPLIDSGDLYILAQVKGEIRLVVLDAATGALQWSQQLAKEQERASRYSTQNRPIRRLTGATPTLAEGVLICPTVTGAIVAVDTATHSLLWGYQYLDVVKTTRSGFGGGIVRATGANTQALSIGNRWADGSASISDGKVIITPTDSTKILCLRLMDGKLLWEGKREMSLYVATSDKDKVVLVTKAGVTALKMTDGSQLWSAALEPGELPSGRGFHSGNSYYLPTSEQRVVRVDLEKGEIKQTFRSREMLGNLICYGDSVISHGPTWLTVFYQKEAMQLVVADRLKKNPDDIWALARQGEVLVHDDRRDEAIDVLRRALDLTEAESEEPGTSVSSKEEVRRLLYDTMLDAIEIDFAKNEKMVDQVKALAATQEQKNRLYRIVADGLQKTGRIEEAFQAYLQLAGISDDKEVVIGDYATMESITRQLSTRRDRWFRGRMAQLYLAANDTQRERMSDTIRKRFETIAISEDRLVLQQYVDFFADSPFASTAKLQLGRHLFESGDLARAERYLTEVADCDDQSIAVAATAIMAQLLRKVDWKEDAAVFENRLLLLYADVADPEGKTGRELFEEISPLAKTASSSLWPEGRIDVDPTGPKSPFQPHEYIRVFNTVQSPDELTPSLRMTVDRNRNVFVAGSDGRQHVRLQLPTNVAGRYFSNQFNLAEAVSGNHTVVLTVGHQMVAINALQEAAAATPKTPNPAAGIQRILWTKDRSPFSGSTNRYYYFPRSTQTLPWGGRRVSIVNQPGQERGGVGPITRHGFIYQHMRAITCVDPLDVETVYWTREGARPGSLIYGDDKAIYVLAPSSHGSTTHKTEAMVLNPVDGTLLGRFTPERKGTLWTNYGRKLLYWNTEGGKVKISMYDLWDFEKNKARENPVIWSHEFNGSSKGSLVDNKEVVILQSDGQLAVIDLADGQIRLKTKIESESPLTEVHAMRSPGRYIITTNTITTSGSTRTGNRTVQAIPRGYGAEYSPLVKGRVYALDSDNGEQLWPASVSIDTLGLPLQQPQGTPVLFFLTSINEQKPGSNIRKNYTSILAIDKRDGRIITNAEARSTSTQNYHIQATPEDRTINVMLPTQTYTFKLTDEPRPPAPPGQTGDIAQAPKKGSLSGIAGAIFGRPGVAIIKGAAKQPIPQRDNNAQKNQQNQRDLKEAREKAVEAIKARIEQQKKDLRAEIEKLEKADKKEELAKQKAQLERLDQALKQVDKVTRDPDKEKEKEKEAVKEAAE